MSGEQFPMINGMRYSFASIEANVDGALPFTGFTEVSYADAVNEALVRGTAPNAVGSTIGEYEAECSFTMHKKDGQALLEYLGGRGGYLRKRFNLVVSYDEPDGDGVHTDTVLGLRITRVEDGHASGPEGLTMKFTTRPMKLIRGAARAL